MVQTERNSIVKLLDVSDSFLCYCCIDASFRKLHHYLNHRGMLHSLTGGKALLASKGGLCINKRKSIEVVPSLKRCHYLMLKFCLLLGNILSFPSCPFEKAPLPEPECPKTLHISSFCHEPKTIRFVHPDWPPYETHSIDVFEAHPFGQRENNSIQYVHFAESNNW